MMPTFKPVLFLIGVATIAAAPISPNGFSEEPNGFAGDSGINEGADEPNPEPPKPEENPEPLLFDGIGIPFEGVGTLFDGVGTADGAAVFIAATRLSDGFGLLSETADISPRPNVEPSFSLIFTSPTDAGVPQTAQNFAPRRSSRPHLPQYVLVSSSEGAAAGFTSKAVPQAFPQTGQNFAPFGTSLLHFVQIILKSFHKWANRPTEQTL